MKYALAILMVSVCIASAVDVRFNLRDFLGTSTPLTRRVVEIQPQSTPLSSGTNVVVSERRLFNSGPFGEFTATNVVTGVYRVVVYGATFTNVFRINVPETTGTTNASAILVSSADNGIETEDGRSIDIE